MSSNRPDFGTNLRLEDVFGSPAVQQSASDATDYMAGINPRKAETAQNQAAEFKVNLNTGTMDMSNVPITKVGEYLGARQQQDDIQRIYAQSLAELQRERAAQAAHPFANTLAQIGAAIAAGDRDPRVRSLGQLAQNLNPTPQTLRERELEVLRGAGAYEIGRERTGLAQLGMLQREQSLRTAEGKLLTDRQRYFMNEMRLSARGGEPVQKEAFLEAAKVRGFGPIESESMYLAHLGEAAAMKSGKEAELGRKKTFADYAEEIRAKGDVRRGRIQLSNRMAEIQQAFTNSVSDTAMDFRVKLKEHEALISQQAAGRKELSVLGPAPQKALVQASTTNQYIGTVEHMLDQPEWAQVQGPLFQFKPGTKPGEMGEFTFNPQAVIPKSFQNIPRTQVTSQIAHEIPRLLTILLNSQAGGASILRIEAGQKLIKDMGITGSVRPDQALAIMKIVRDTNNNNIASVMRLKPNANWGEMRDLLGVDDPKNSYYFYDKKDAFGGPVHPFPSFERRSTAPSEAPKTEKKYPWER